MPHNYARSQSVADRMIRKYGAVAALRRANVDRMCYAVESDFTPAERAGKLINPVDRLFLVSSMGLLIPPNNEVDTLIFKGEVLRIKAPPGRLAPAGIVVYWELQVSR